MRAPPLYHLYVALTCIMIPFASRSVIRKLRRAGVPTLRAHETLGHASLPRVGGGPLIWFHAASVGESLSVLALISRMGELLPRAQFLITSGTPTSAELIAQQMPPRCQHQFAPLDAPGPVSRFLKHWRPAAAIFVESELWPQMLRRTRETGARLVLVNARLSDKSRAAWQRRPRTAAYVLDVFDLILSQNDEMAQAMVDLNAPADRVARGINLKSLSDPLKKDSALLATVRTALKGRPVWVAASTHKGEEEEVLRAHRLLIETFPDLLLILVPRHPERSEAVAGLIADAGMSFAVRSQGDLPREENVYLADTLGELGSWYDLTDVVFLGGSLQSVGGHNPFEVVQAGAALLSGPHVVNFAETYAELESRQAVSTVSDADELAAEVAALFNDRMRLDAAQRASRGFVRGKSDALGTIARRLIRALGLDEGTG